MTLVGKAFDIRTQKLSSVRMVAVNFQQAAESAVQWYNDLTPAEQTARGELRGLNWVQDGVVVSLPIEPFSVTVQMVDQNGNTIDPSIINDYGLYVSPQITSYDGGHPIPIIISAGCNTTGITASVITSLFKINSDGTELQRPFPSIAGGKWQTIIENVSENTVFKVMFDVSMAPTAPVPVSDINLPIPYWEFPNEGASYQITASVIPANATNTNILFTSGDSSCFSVNATGVVTAISDPHGAIVPIIVSSQDGGFAKIFSCKVTQPVVIPVTGITVPTVTLQPSVSGGYIDYAAMCSVQPYNATDQRIWFASSNPTAANLDRQTGDLRAYIAGETGYVIACTQDGQFIGSTPFTTIA